MSRDSYVKKVNVMLNCPTNYERNTVNVDKLDKHAQVVTADATKHKIPPKLSNALQPHHSHMNRFYGLPKDYKPDLPLRPMVSSCGSSTSNVSLWECILNQLLKFAPANLSSTGECIKESNIENVSEECIVGSLDVKSLYSNILIDESVHVAMEMLEKRQSKLICSTCRWRMFGSYCCLYWSQISLCLVVMCNEVVDPIV